MGKIKKGLTIIGIIPYTPKSTEISCGRREPLICNTYIIKEGRYIINYYYN